MILAGYGLNLLALGVNNIPAEVNLTAPLQRGGVPSQTVGPIAVVGTTTIMDPTPANHTSDDESATPLAVRPPSRRRPGPRPAVR